MPHVDTQNRLRGWQTTETAVNNSRTLSMTASPIPIAGEQSDPVGSTRDLKIGELYCSYSHTDHDQKREYIHIEEKGGISLSKRFKTVMVLWCRDTPPAKRAREENGRRDGKAYSALPPPRPDLYKFLCASARKAVTASEYHDFHSFPQESREVRTQMKKKQTRPGKQSLRPVFTDLRFLSSCQAYKSEPHFIKSKQHLV